MKYKIGKFLSPFAVFSIVFTAIALILLFVARSSVTAADLLNSTLCFGVRRTLAAIADIIPFSVYELVLLSAPLIVIGVLISAIIVFRRGYGRTRFLINIVSALLLLYAGNVIALSISYNTTTVDKAMGIPIVKITEENLSETMIALRDEINLLAPEIKYNSEGASAPGYTMDEISEELCNSYSEISVKYGFIPAFSSRAKGVGPVGSVVMSYLGILGIYFYPTGESNVNTAYPLYDVVFTAAHELSHQRGILRENEANFMAYLALSESDHPYFRYSGALNLYSYIGSALYRTDPERYYEISSGLCNEARGDLRASSAVSKKYGDTFIADISSFINDLFLKSNGTAGTVTYGRVVTLAVSYFELNKN